MKKNDVYFYILFILIILIEYSVSEIKYDISFSIKSIISSIINILYLLLTFISFFILGKVAKLKENHKSNYKIISLFSFMIFIVFPINIGFGVAISIISILFTAFIVLILNNLRIKFHNPYLISILIIILCFMLLNFYK